jgi:hypothetical protein
MDANSGEPWSEMDIADLRASLDYGNTFGDAASTLCRDEDEVRQEGERAWLGGAPRQSASGPFARAIPTTISAARRQPRGHEGESGSAALFKTGHGTF